MPDAEGMRAVRTAFGKRYPAPPAAYLSYDFAGTRKLLDFSFGRPQLEASPWPWERGRLSAVAYVERDGESLQGNAALLGVSSAYLQNLDGIAAAARKVAWGYFPKLASPTQDMIGELARLQRDGRIGTLMLLSLCAQPDQIYGPVRYVASDAILDALARTAGLSVPRARARLAKRNPFKVLQALFGDFAARGIRFTGALAALGVQLGLTPAQAPRFEQNLIAALKRTLQRDIERAFIAAGF